VTIATSNFLVPNGTFIVELIAFVIVLVVVGRFVLPPVNRLIRERQARIEAELAAADQARDEAARAAEERRAALEEARRRAREIIEQANRSAEQVREAAIAQGQEEHDRILAAASSELEQARRRALDEATARMGELVVEAVERVIGRTVDSAVHRDLIDEAISGIQAQDRAATGGGR
jgi:F-type H+-transporting ATPase subunit b